MGRQRYPQARELTITADCGGSNGARLRLWKVELQKLANETGLVIHVHHYPPGTSKWNKIEHRLFCHITQNWRGRPLTDRLAVVELIGATTTKTGLKVESVLDTRTYQKGIKVTNAAMKRLDITGDQFHPDGTTQSSPGHPDNRSTYCSGDPKPPAGHYGAIRILGPFPTRDIGARLPDCPPLRFCKRLSTWGKERGQKPRFRLGPGDRVSPR